MKTKLTTICFALAAALACEKKPEPQAQIAIDQASIQLYFSPQGGASAAIVATLDNAKESVRVQAYSFTSAPIAEALKRAHGRGVDVVVILDKSQRTEKYSSATFLDRAGISVWIDRKHAIAHNKIIIIDGATVITGSFNFSKAAEERNAENLLIVANKQIAEKYMANWMAHWEHSEAY